MNIELRFTAVFTMTAASPIANGIRGKRLGARYKRRAVPPDKQICVSYNIHNCIITTIAQKRKSFLRRT
jgi:hypothetical protein